MQYTFLLTFLLVNCVYAQSHFAVWSNKGPIRELHCINIPDPRSKLYNLCTYPTATTKFSYSSKGPLKGLECLPFKLEAATPSNSDYLCHTQDGQYEYIVSYYDPVFGSCTLINDASPVLYLCAIPKVVDIINVHGSPSLFEYKDTLYGVVQRDWFLYYFIIYSDLKISALKLIPDSHSLNSVSSTLFKDAWLLFYLDDKTAQFWYNTFFNGKWTGIKQVSFAKSVYAPAAVTFQNQVFLIYQNAGVLYAVTLNGNTWRSPVQITLPFPNQVIGAPSCAVTTNTKIVCAFKARNVKDDGAMFTIEYSNNKWHALTRIDTPTISTTPSITSSDKLLYIVYSLEGSNQIQVMELLSLPEGGVASVSSSSPLAAFSAGPASATQSSCMGPPTVFILYQDGCRDTPYGQLSLLYLNSHSSSQMVWAPFVPIRLQADFRFTMHMTADPQYVWCDNETNWLPVPECDSRWSDMFALKMYWSSLYITSQYSGVNSDSTGPTSPNIQATMINGDMTEHGKPYQISAMQEYLGALDKYWLGLGNHDFADDCHNDQCRTGSVLWLQSWSQNQAPIRPLNIDLKTGTKVVNGIVTNTVDGSLAYSYNLNNYRFIQLHNNPYFSAAWPGVLFEPFITNWYITVYQPIVWLLRQLDDAAARGDKVILAFHDPGQNFNPTVFAAALKNYTNICAAFVGHYHSLIGPNGSFGNIPTFYSGSSMFHRFLKIGIDTSRGASSALNVLEVQNTYLRPPVHITLVNFTQQYWAC